jgi:hypothetical protein
MSKFVWKRENSGDFGVERSKTLKHINISYRHVLGFFDVS